MTTSVTVARQALCAGGDHVTIRVTLTTPSFTADYAIPVPRLLRTLGQLDEQERETILMGIILLHCRGMTKAQINSALLTGFTVVV